MFLAEGLLAYGGAKMWKRGELSAVLPLVLGCLIAIATDRTWAGSSWPRRRPSRCMHRFAGSTATGRWRFSRSGSAFAIFVPIALSKSSDKELESVQQSQDANASDTKRTSHSREWTTPRVRR